MFRVMSRGTRVASYRPISQVFVLRIWNERLKEMEFFPTIVRMTEMSNVFSGQFAFPYQLLLT